MRGEGIVTFDLAVALVARADVKESTWPLPAGRGDRLNLGLAMQD